MSKANYKVINVLSYILAKEAVDKGLISSNNKIVKMIFDNCFLDWSAFKLQMVMGDLDREVALLTQFKEIEFNFSETKKGPTPLGGPMQLSARLKRGD